MRRPIFVISAVFLIFDLADDGRLGKFRLVVPSAKKNSVCFSSHKSGKVESRVDLPSLNLQEFHTEIPEHPASFGAVHCFDKSNFYSPTSAGGIPL